MAAHEAESRDTPALPTAATLTSWKEIAAFFKRDSRTVQRWERFEGLPVHRHLHNRQSSVYAYPNELEEWWRLHLSRAPDPAVGARGWKGRFVLAAASVIAVTFVAWGAVSLARPIRVWAPAVQRLAEGSGVPWVRSFADVTGDGIDDLIVHGHTDAGIYIGRAARTAPKSPDVTITTSPNTAVTAGAVGDVDGDGIADLVVGTLLKEPEGFGATGPNYLVLGRRQWPAVFVLPRDADAVLTLDVPNDARMGPCLDSGPVDVNHDSLSDIVLGAPDFSPVGRPSAGGVFILHGRRNWSPRVDVRADASLTVYGSRAGEGLAGCAAGDVNGDRRVDLLIAASENRIWNLLGGRSRVYVLAGRSDWPRVIDLAELGAPVIEGTEPGALVSPLRLADFNGDGFDDMAVGLIGGAPARGRVAMFLGRRDIPLRRSVADADVVLEGPESPNAFGTALNARDVNDDGRADLVVSDPQRGSIHVIFGREPWPKSRRLASHRPWSLVSGQRGAGAHNLVFGDFDDDGATELAFPVMSPAGPDASAWSGVITPYLPLVIDIRPSFVPNVLVRSGLLVIGVPAAQGGAFHDLDLASVRLAGVAPTRTARRDFDNDGQMDVLFYFDSVELDGRVRTGRLALIGRTRRGLPVAGADDILVLAERAPGAAR